MTSATTRWVALLGWPVAHSRSPAIHTAALEALSIDAAYLAHAVPPSALELAVQGLRGLGAIGANVTLPHKERVKPFLDHVEPIAEAIGAVNTIVREGERLIGTNTDAEGLVRSLREAGLRLDGGSALVVGAGGAARASVLALASLGVARIDVAARQIWSAEQLANDLGRHVSATLAPIDLGDPKPMRRAAENARVMIQATSATLKEADAGAFAARLPIASLPPEAAVVDLVYTPRRTAVLAAAEARELKAVDGLGMLIWQAAIAFERWFGVAPPIDVMRRAAG